VLDAASFDQFEAAKIILRSANAVQKPLQELFTVCLAGMEMNHYTLAWRSFLDIGAGAARFPAKVFDPIIPFKGTDQFISGDVL
jgi:hypothetical protein